MYAAMGFSTTHLIFATFRPRVLTDGISDKNSETSARIALLAQNVLALPTSTLTMTRRSYAEYNVDQLFHLCTMYQTFSTKAQKINYGAIFSN